MLKIRHPKTKLFLCKKQITKKNHKPKETTFWGKESEAVVFTGFEDNKFLDACQLLRSPLDFVTVET